MPDRCLQLTLAAHLTITCNGRAVHRDNKSAGKSRPCGTPPRRPSLPPSGAGWTLSAARWTSTASRLAPRLVAENL